MSNYKKRRGDRKDGRLLRTLTPFAKFMPYIMNHRNDAHVFYDESFEVTDVDRELRKLRVAGYKGIGILHFLIAAYIRIVSMLPGANRFVVGNRVFTHGDDIAIVMVVKRGMGIDSTETTIKVHFKPTDTIFDVYHKMNEKIEEVKADTGDNNTEEVAGMFSKLPRFLMRIAIKLLFLLDHFDKLPEWLLEASPFHGSMIITDLGSLRLGPAFHHIYNIGTLPIFIAFGAKRHAYELDRHGQVVDKKYVDCKFTLDERIIDGCYGAKALQAMRYMFQHPEIVETPPTKVVDDIK